MGDDELIEIHEQPLPIQQVESNFVKNMASIIARYPTEDITQKIADTKFSNNISHNCSKRCPKENESGFFYVEATEEECQIYQKMQDMTCAVCDVCASIEPVCNGGVALKERDGTTSIICQTCWDTFTIVSFKQKKELGEQNIYMKRALEKKVGVNPKLPCQFFDKKKSFAENCTLFKINQRDEWEWTYTGNPKKPFEPIVKKKQRYDACTYCMNPIPKAVVNRCSGCKVAYYCNTDCQKKHWKGHKPTCLRWQSLFKQSLK